MTTSATMMIRSERLRHAPFVLFVVGVLAYGAAFAWYLLDRFDLFNLIDDVNEDDAFYYFQIAWHMAEGRFSTFDGGLTRTNGYHPLWLFLITPFYWVFDKTEALFAIKAFEIMLVAGGVALVAGAARVARLPWVLLFAALPALYRNEALFMGLEAAAALFLLGLFLLAVCLYARDPAGWRWPLAAVAFALPWVRLEYAAISVAATAALCLVEWSGVGPGVGPPPHRHLRKGGSRARRGGWSGWRRSVFARNAAAPLAGAVAGILAYFAYNAVVFGGVVPVSAAAKALMSQQVWEWEGGYSLTENFRAHLLRTDHFDDELLAALEICVYAGLVWWFSRRSRGRDDWLLLAFLVGMFGLAAGHLAKFAQSVLTTHPTWFRMDWYFVPAYLMGALAVPARCCVAVWFVRRFIWPKLRLAPGDDWRARSPRSGTARTAGGLVGRQTEPPGDDWRARVPSLGIVVVGAVFLFPTADVTAPFRFVDGRREAISRYKQFHDYMGNMVANRVLPEDSVIASASGGSGVLAYFSRFTVVNLDGLVNSWDYLRALRAGTDVAFRQRYGITHFAYLGAIDGERHRFSLFEGPLMRESRSKHLKLWPAERLRKSWGGVDRSDWLWERLEPHLEHQTDGVGLLVDGRLAQAFARDCAGGMAEWTWAGQAEPVRAPWTPTSIGFCASAVVLPDDARPPVRAVTTTAGEYLTERVGGRRPAIDADFDVYLVETAGPERRFGGSARNPADPPGVRAAPRRRFLVYAKDEECGTEDLEETTFFLHVDPVDPDDLPGPRRRHGFDNLDFQFRFRGGGLMFKPCVAEVPLPEYGIAAIRTGQFVAAEGGFHRLWEGEIHPAPAR